MKNLLTILLLVLATNVYAQSATLYPAKPTSYVTDLTNSLSAGGTQKILNRINYLDSSTHVEIAVVILPTLKDYAPVDVATEIGRNWGVGKRAEVGQEDRNNGLVLLLVPKTAASNNKGTCFIGTGNGMEGRITDARASQICIQTIIPYLRNGDWDNGVLAGVNKIIDYSIQTKVPPQTPATTQTDTNVSPLFFIVPLLILGVLVLIGTIVSYKHSKEREVREEQERLAEAERERLKEIRLAQERKEADARRKAAAEKERKRWNALTPAQQAEELAEKDRLAKAAAIAAAVAAAEAEKRRKRHQEEEEEESRRRRSYDSSSSSGFGSGFGGGSSGGGSGFGGFGGGGGFSGGGGGGSW